MEQHINYITLGVADLAESRRFYREVFGWQETADSNENIAFFQAGNALLLALLARIRRARRISRDFEASVPATALILQLLDELETLRKGRFEESNRDLPL